MKVRLEFIAKELALFELFLWNNSPNSRGRQVFWLLFVCLSMEEALFGITITFSQLLTETGLVEVNLGFYQMFSYTDIAVKKR